VGIERILITGGSGFLGTNLLFKLKNQKVRLFSTYYKNRKFTKVKKVKYTRVNLENKKNCLKVCKNIDTVVMCAANSSGAAIMQKKPLVHLNPNVFMNLNMLEAAYQSGVKKFIFISSNTVYPEVNHPVKEEEASFNFFKKYFIVGWMKRFSEVVCDIYSSKINSPMKTIIIRPGNLYGPFDKFDKEKSKVIPSLIKKIVERQNPLEVWGDGKDLKDFLYIEDFCNAVIKIMRKKNLSKIYNIASGKGVTINQIISILFKIEKIKNIKIKYDKTKPTMIPKRLININKAKKEIGIINKTSISIGLEKTIKWYKEIYDHI
tara:strand:- start:28 stop:984 length:957 start_codon:yes stop_codon:yes gene_type:complete